MRPHSPSWLLELSDLLDFGICLSPATEVWEWLQAETLTDAGSLLNDDHAHLLDADIWIMWVSSSADEQLNNWR